MKDIFKAYQIGNVFLINPIEVLEYCRSSNTNFDSVELERKYVEVNNYGLLYIITINDIKELIKKGYSLREIFRAYELGNWHAGGDPKALLENSRNENKSLDVAAKEIKDSMVYNILQKLIAKYPAEYEFLKKENLDMTAQHILLGAYDISEVSSFADLVKDYKINGEKALINLKPKLPKKETLEKYGLTEEDVEGIEENQLNKLIEFCGNNPKLDLKKMVRGLRDQIAKTRSQRSSN